MKLIYWTTVIGGVYIMYLDLYHVFYVTAQEKTFSQAAKKLDITQPSVSYSIKQLEEKIGVQLFHSTSKGASITNEGRTLIEYIQQAVRMIDNEERKITELTKLVVGHVTIGGCDST